MALRGVAGQADDAIEVLRPTRGDAEAGEIRELLARWTASHPDAGPEIILRDDFRPFQ